MKNIFQKCWRERKKQYLCTRKTTGTMPVDKEGKLLSESSLNE